jgi:hypothetical protein
MPTLTLGVLLEVGKYTLQVNLPSSNQPIRIAAVTDAGSTVVRLDNSGGTWSCQTTQTAPAVAERTGDFSYLYTITPILDFTSAGGSVPFPYPFPADIMPLSRLDPVWLSAVAQIPAVNSLSPPELNGSMQPACNVASGVFTVNDTTNLAISRFPHASIRPVLYEDLNIQALRQWQGDRPGSSNISRHSHGPGEVTRTLAVSAIVFGASAQQPRFTLDLVLSSSPGSNLLAIRHILRDTGFLSDHATLRDAMLHFADFENCWELMIELRWPDGKIKFPTCGAEKATRLAEQRI